MSSILDLARGLVRPFITVTGWIAIVILAVMLALRFADKEMALVIIGILTGSMATVIGFWFNERTKQKE